MFDSDRSEADEGLASWYGPGFEGRETASGETYDPNGYTAAHKTLPFGTDLIVSYGQRSVPVTVNDRGPFLGTRELDLSQAAARDLGLIPEGVGYVEYDIVGSSPGADLSQQAAQTPAPSQTAAQHPGFPQGVAQQPDPSQGTAQQPELTQGAVQQPEPLQGAAQQPGFTEVGGDYWAGYPYYPSSYPAAQDQANGGTYVVQPGDTLGQIAAQLGIPVEHLARYNGITDPNLIYSGQPLYFLTLENGPVGTGGAPNTNDAAIYNPLEAVDNITTAGSEIAGTEIAGNYVQTSGSDVAAGFTSEHGELWVPTWTVTSNGVVFSGERRMLPPTGVAYRGS